MLRIKRVPTVVSNYQKDESEEVARRGGGCGRNCLNKCCIQGAKLPLYAFKKLNKVVCDKGLPEFENREPPVAFLDSLLLGEWEDRVQRGLFRYDVTACETKVIPGQHGFIAQLNEGRHLKKSPLSSVLIRFSSPLMETNSTSLKLGKKRCSSSLRQAKMVKSSSSQTPRLMLRMLRVLLPQVSPIEYGHVLLIPRISSACHKGLTVTASCLLFTWRQKLEIHTSGWVITAWVHLPPSTTFTSRKINIFFGTGLLLVCALSYEKAPTEKITSTDGGVKISKLLNYPVRGLVFEGGNTLQDLSNTVSDACMCLQDHNVPYNVLIADCGRRIFLFPQCYAEKQALGEVSAELLDTQVNPAVWEISGHMVLKRKKDFEEASEENAWRLLAEVSLSEERFQEVYAFISEAIAAHASLEDSDGKSESLEHVDAINNPLCAMATGTQECLVLQ
ncbi:gdp-l-galactose phosphorylase 1 [Quercus suber]|uniref:Gdp-l-galactose phosphorylase 1 n=1 Tax=Quercus suber TaxID=58331 RepID=A0AAW0M932_QUESU